MNNCPKCSSEQTVKNGRDLKSDRPLFLCKDCNHQWRVGSVTRSKISARERDIWEVWKAHDEKIKPTSRWLRNPSGEPYYQSATPEHVRKVIARVKTKLKDGLEFPD